MSAPLWKVAISYQPKDDRDSNCTRYLRRYHVTRFGEHTGSIMVNGQVQTLEALDIELEIEPGSNLLFFHVLEMARRSRFPEYFRVRVTQANQSGLFPVYTLFEGSDTVDAQLFSLAWEINPDLAAAYKEDIKLGIHTYVSVLIMKDLIIPVSSLLDNMGYTPEIGEALK